MLFLSNLNRTVCKNSGDPDQMPYSVVSDQGMICLSMSIKKFSTLQLFSLLIN